MRRDLPGSWFLMVALATACGPGAAEKKAEPETKADAKVDTKIDAKVDAKDPKPETPKDKPVVAEGLSPGSAELDGRTIETSKVGEWEKRTATGGAGGYDGGPKGGAPYPAAPGAPAAADGLAEGGLGLTGSGVGGGGGYGGGGLGSVGGLGSGTGRGYGSGGAVKEKAEPQKAVKPADGPLKAGATDDNADFKGFLAFLETWTKRTDVTGQFQPLDVAGREFVRVLDSDGRPIPGAQISVADAGSGRELWRARTYGDGRAPFYPKLFGAQVQGSGRYNVAATAEGESLTAGWDGASELVLKTAGSRKDKPMVLEVLFLIDTTGSMGDEIAQVKSTLLAVTGKVKQVRQDLELRYGAVLYRDVFDDYVTMAYPFTADVQKFDQALQSVDAAGGGDLPEAMNQGLDRAVSGVPWQADAAKIVFLIADAPPQMRQKGDVLYGDSAVQAVGRGIRLHAVAASGLDELGTLVLRQLAQLTRGKFIFIEYGSTQASAAKHGVTGPVQSNNLDDIIAREITAEIEGWGRP